MFDVELATIEPGEVAERVGLLRELPDLQRETCA
jgi:hypothetical protein